MFDWPEHLREAPMPPLPPGKGSTTDAIDDRFHWSAGALLIELADFHDTFPPSLPAKSGGIRTEAAAYRYYHGLCAAALGAAYGLSQVPAPNGQNDRSGLPGYLFALGNFVRNSHRDDEDFPGLLSFPDTELKGRTANLDYLQPAFTDLTSAAQAYGVSLFVAGHSAEVLSATSALISRGVEESHALAQHWALVATLIHAIHVKVPDFRTIWD